jgi:hypothetical protein
VSGDTVCVARRLGSYAIPLLALEAGTKRSLGVSSARIAMVATLRLVPAPLLTGAPVRHWRLDVERSRHAASAVFIETIARPALKM